MRSGEEPMHQDDHDQQPPAPSDASPGAPEEAAARDRQDRDHYRTLQKERQARVAKVVVAAAVLVILIVFILSNSQPVKVNFVFLTRFPRLIWVMLACALLGGIFGYLVGRPRRQVRLHRGERAQPPT
jgi:uncharacterized integral membrane protein